MQTRIAVYKPLPEIWVRPKVDLDRHILNQTVRLARQDGTEAGGTFQVDGMPKENGEVLLRVEYTENTEVGIRLNAFRVTQEDIDSWAKDPFSCVLQIPWNHGHPGFHRQAHANG
jgi:hypothetical protein